MSAVEPVQPPTPLRNVADASSSTDAGDVRIGATALRKASVRLIPLIAIAYGVAYTDRVNISFAALQMNRDLHFSASSYGLGAGLFFLSYAACEIPSNLLLYRFGARRWIARIMFTWGFLAMGMMFVRTPREFYIVRFLLGMSEAGFFPEWSSILASGFRRTCARVPSADFTWRCRSARSSWAALRGRCSISRAAWASPAGNGCFWRRVCLP